MNMNELHAYIKPQVERVARKQYNNEQTPQLSGAKRIKGAGVDKIESTLYMLSNRNLETDESKGVGSYEPREVAGMDHSSPLFNLGLKWAF